MTYPLELHPIPDETEEQASDSAGLPLAENDELCEHCESRIGRGRGMFVPYVVVLNQDDDYWFVCENCAGPVLDPGIPE